VAFRVEGCGGWGLYRKRLRGVVVGSFCTGARGCVGFASGNAAVRWAGGNAEARRLGGAEKIEPHGAGGVKMGEGKARKVSIGVQFCTAGGAVGWAGVRVGMPH